MHQKLDTDLKYTAILAAVAAVIGFYLFASTVVVSKDCCVFIEHAKYIQDYGFAKAVDYYSQHSGYSAMIWLFHSIIFGGAPDNSGWIISAQMTSLICRVLSAVPFYLIARLYVSPRNALAAGLVMLVLPIAAHNGSDGLSDSVHLFFLLCGYYFLIRGSIGGKCGLFALAGLFSGLAYLIRPEGLQIAACGVIWLLSRLFAADRKLGRMKAVAAALFLVGGCGAVIAPYIYMEGALFSKKNLMESVSVSEQANQALTVCKAEVAGWQQIRAAVKANERISAVHHWYFFPIAAAGLFFYVKNTGLRKEKCGLILLIYAANVVLCALLFVNYGYISPRHAIAIAVILCVFIPYGAQSIAAVFDKKPDSKLWVWILIAGAAVCMPKLIEPINSDYRHIHQASKWLMDNTSKADVIAVIDPRFELYCQRNCVVMYDEVTLPYKYDYVVTHKPLRDPQSQQLRLVAEFKDKKTGYIYRNTD